MAGGNYFFARFLFVIAKIFFYLCAQKKTHYVEIFQPIY